MRDIIFACILGSGEAEKDALRLARSIRTFGGEFCFSPIWMLSRRNEDELSEQTRNALFSLGARLVGYDVDQKEANYPFASYVTAAAIAEGLAQGQASYLVMMANDTLVLQPPSMFLLPGGKSLGGCPVHLKLLGSGIDEEVDEFWQLIYRHCQVARERIFSMQSIVDEQVIRAYVNAGLLVVRPERGLLRAWQANFERLYPLPEFEVFYRQSELYEIFMHQAVLAGTFLSLLQPEEFYQLPFWVNYPLHLHTKVRGPKKPVNLDELITCRFEEYDEFFNHPNLDRMIYIDKPLKDWLKAQS